MLDFFFMCACVCVYVVFSIVMKAVSCFVLSHRCVGVLFKSICKLNAPRACAHVRL